ncbi:MAG: hypothetical protein M1290_04025 [Candidatus Thermoplasmatota archaeon]|nr:hypothetical protein [Candidatus Thermoplasmatota archaeon]MCL5789617.1 hypothetical protein [Candidatus Thermoplasmatota archaeon]
MKGNKRVLEIARGNLQENAVWFMRQAGRYLPDYDSLKGGRTFLDMLGDPITISRVSSLPLKYMDVDAIVIFTDILVPLTRMGYVVNYDDGITVTKRKGEEVDYYQPLADAIRKIKEEHGDKTLVGVVGGPFTTLSYLYDQGGTGYHLTKEVLASGHRTILKKLTDEIVDFAKLQAGAGVDVIQVFDSWLGWVSDTFYSNHLEQNESYFMEKIKDLGKPVIFFSEGSSHLYRKFIALRPDVYSIDWRMNLRGFGELCTDCILQGNLDPHILGADDSYLKKETERIMDEGKGLRGHIFNLGHGVPPWADWKKLALIAGEVHSYDR